jgi:hypothetical protein
MRLIAVISLLGLALSPVARSAVRGRVISDSGVRVAIPARWYASTAKSTICDPQRLLVASSAPIRFRPGGRLAPPARGQVLLLVMEDRYVQDRPSGDLRRPTHFSVSWHQLRHLDGGSACSLPDSPAYLRYFEAHGRFIGFIVFPGSRVGATTRAKTLAVMDSIRVDA